MRPDLGVHLETPAITSGSHSRRSTPLGRQHGPKSVVGTAEVAHTAKRLGLAIDIPPYQWPDTIEHEGHG